MASLQDVIAKIQEIVGAISGIRAAPEYAPEQLNEFPILVCFADSGSYDIGPTGVMKELHNIVLVLHVARKDMARDIEKAMGYAQSIPLAIMADPTLGNTVSTIGLITYTFGEMFYNEQKTVGFRFTLEKVKLQTTII